MRLCSIVESLRLSTSPHSTQGAKWIQHVYSQFPENPLNHRERYMHFEDGGIGVFELVPDIDRESGATIKWIQTHPQNTGVGKRTIQKLQDLAQQQGITLSLYAWEDSQMGSDALIKFYQSLGFQPQPGGDLLVWEPTKSQP